MLVPATPEHDPVRWLDYARRSMQRLGFIKFAVALASPTSSTTLEGLTARLQTAVNKTEAVPPELLSRMSEYIGEHRRMPRSRLRTGTPTTAKLQDMYLADPLLPSSSGAITGEPNKDYRHAVYVEMPAWAVGLGLLRAKNYTQTDRGRLIPIIDRGLNKTMQSFDADGNPFRLSLAERFFFLYSLLDADGDIMSYVFADVGLLSGESITRTVVGERVTLALRELPRTKWRQAPGARGALEAKAAAVVRAVDKSTNNGMGPLESLGTPRAEPFVDCGILERVSRTSYDYRVTETGLRVAHGLRAARSVSEFLDAGLAHIVVQDRPAEASSPPEVWPRVLSAYRELRTGLGYVSVRELGLLAVAQQIAANGPLFEIRDAIDAIRNAAKEKGRTVRLAQSRSRGGGQVRIDLKDLETPS